MWKKKSAAQYIRRYTLTIISSLDSPTKTKPNPLLSPSPKHLSVLNQPPNHNRAVLPSSLHNQILLKAPLEPSPTFPVLSFHLLLKQPSTGKKFLLVRILVGDCYSTRGRYVLKKKRKSSNPLLIYNLHSGNAILITGRQRYNRYYHPVM